MLRGSLKKNHNQVATLKDDMSPKEGSNSSDIPSANCNQTLGNPLPSLSSSTITTTATATATTMTSLSIVRPITIEPISTATTTTMTITTESTRTSVSTDGNLIGKMINDVSTTTMIYRPIAVGALHSIAKVPAAANHEIVGDFPSNDEQNDSSDTLTTDASNMTNTITLLESAAEELTSTASKLTTISTATTELDAVKYATHGRQRMAIIISEMKSESTENKCKPEELATVSRQRELEANSTKATSTATTTGALANLNWNKIDVRNLDITREPHKGLAPIKDKQLTFAARNAKLKLAFFKYPYHLENRHKLPALTKVPKKTEALIQAAKVINNPELNHFSCAQPNLILGRSFSRRATNLKLRIPEQLIKPSTRAVLESTKLSLVAQRKADLSRRFEEQSAIKTSTCQSKKSTFPSVAQLKLKYDRFTRKPQTQQRINSMIVNPNKLSDIASPETLLLKPIETMEQRHSPLSDEGCNLGQSPYSSDDNEDNVSIRTTSTILERKRKDKVARSASSDSALGLEVDDPMPEVAAIPPPPQQQQQRRMTLTVTDLPLRSALLPLAEPTALPDSPSTDSQATSQSLLSQSVVPSKVLLEERVVEIPEDPRYIGCNSLSSSRRESAQSCISDYPNSECSGVRFVRTPSVVVSDYSDDVMCGITLEEIEYFRAQRMRRRRSSLDTSGTEKDADGSHSDVSASSSCSNLYYCGSTISALDGAECYVNGIRMPLPERKASDCSTCSASGEEEDAFTIPEQPEDTTGQMGKDLADLLAAQHLSTKRPKKPSGWRKIRNIVQWTPFFQTYKKQRYPWVQLAGHQGNFKAGPEQGTVLKKLCPKEEDCFQVLMKDVLRPYVPEYKGQVTSEDGESVYLQLQDLLSDFYQPCVMDCKIGVRTYLEEELSKAKEKPKLRKDMYEKMIQIDPDAPNEDEHKAKGVTKPRYMVWRETISSTATLGFRIEGIKKSDGTSSKDFKTTKSREQIKQAFREFINGSQHALPRYIQRLRAIHATLECSDFFRTHEVIGSSLLFVHDRTHASVWLIDFAKTVTLPSEHQIDHNTKWKVGNHEDGYLIGINNLIELFSELEMEGVARLNTSELTVSTTSSSTSSSASLSPMRSVSESNIDESSVGTLGGDTTQKKHLEQHIDETESSNTERSDIGNKEQKSDQCPEKEDLEEMEKTTTKI